MGHVTPIYFFQKKNDVPRVEVSNVVCICRPVFSKDIQQHGRMMTSQITQWHPHYEMCCHRLFVGNERWWKWFNETLYTFASRSLLCLWCCQTLMMKQKPHSRPLSPTIASVSMVFRFYCLFLSLIFEPNTYGLCWKIAELSFKPLCGCFPWRQEPELLRVELSTLVMCYKLDTVEHTNVAESDICPLSGVATNHVW